MLHYKDRVWEIITNPGSSPTITLSSTPKDASYKTVASVFEVGDNFYYLIKGLTTWEVGLGTYLGAGSFSRDTVLSNSSGTTALISFAAGTYDFMNIVASETVQQLAAYSITPLYSKFANHLSY